MSETNVYEHVFRVQPEDIDQMGHVNNVVYLRYAQDAAVAHWLAFATREQLDLYVWVARRHEIDYLRPAYKDDELMTRTWVGEATGATYERFVDVTRPRDNQILAKVRSVWVLLDAKSLRPRRITDEMRLQYGVRARTPSSPQT